MSSNPEIKYPLDFWANKRSQRESKVTVHSSRADSQMASVSIPRIARLLALAIRFDGLLRAEKFRDYAELARLGRVTRARMTQIMKLLNLASDIQEQILFLPNLNGLNERNLRRIVSRIDWNEQRRMFQKIVDRFDRAGDSAGAYARCGPELGRRAHRCAAVARAND